MNARHRRRGARLQIDDQFVIVATPAGIKFPDPLFWGWCVDHARAPLKRGAGRASFGAMALHLLKLSVGSACLEDIRAWAEASATARKRAGGRFASRITTRTAPRRADEVLAGGSLYWVTKGSLTARQRIVAFEPFDDADGIARVFIHLEPTVVPVRPRPCRPFQGWRYLKSSDVPADLSDAACDGSIPVAMRRELSELCLI